MFPNGNVHVEATCLDTCTKWNSLTQTDLRGKEVYYLMKEAGQTAGLVDSMTQDSDTGFIHLFHLSATVGLRDRFT